MMRTNTIEGWCRWKFHRFNGPPISINTGDIVQDAEYDLFKHYNLTAKQISDKRRYGHDMSKWVNLTKAQFRKKVIAELDKLVSEGFLTKNNTTYTGDHIRPDAKSQQLKPEKVETKPKAKPKPKPKSERPSMPISWLNQINKGV